MKAYSAGIFFLYTKRISRVFIRNFLWIYEFFESEMEYGGTKPPEKNNIFSNKLGNWQNDNFIGSFCKQL